MSVNKTWNGVTYSIPNTRSESGWETTLSTYLQALADNAATTTFNKQAVRKATTTPVTVSASTDCTIIVDLTGPGASTVNLPAGADKQIFVIVDGKGDASTNNITIDANGSETIEGSLTKVIRLNRECLVLQYSSSAGDWKVIGGYVPNMVGGPASSTDNAIVRFDGTTGKLIQNSGATIDDSNQVSAASFTVTGGTAANNTIYVASNVLRLRGGTSGLSFFSTGGAENLNVSDAGTASWTTTSGQNLILKKSTGSSMSWWADTAGSSNVYSIDNNSGTLRFYNNGGTVNGTVSQIGGWTLGTASPGASVAHIIQGYVNSGTASVFSGFESAVLTVSNRSGQVPSICFGTTSKTSAISSSTTYPFSVNNSSHSDVIVVHTNGVYGYNPGTMRAVGVTSGQVLGDTTVSKRSLKQDFNELNWRGVYSLPVYSFKWKSNGDLDVGCIADEVASHLPEFAYFSSEGEPEGVNYTKLSLVCIKALQEQQALISALQARIEALENP